MRDLTWEELMEWRVIDRYVQPLPDPWLQTALLASIQAGKPVADFYPISPKPMTPEETRKKAKADFEYMRALFGGK